MGLEIILESEFAKADIPQFDEDIHQKLVNNLRY